MKSWKIPSKTTGYLFIPKSISLQKQNHIWSGKTSWAFRVNEKGKGEKNSSIFSMHNENTHRTVFVCVTMTMLWLVHRVALEGQCPRVLSVPPSHPAVQSQINNNSFSFQCTNHAMNDFCMKAAIKKHYYRMLHGRLKPAQANANKVRKLK